MTSAQRPASVRAICWAWVVFAFLLFFFSIILLNLAGYLLWGSLVGWFLLFFGLVLLGIAAVGATSSVHFLQREAWSRTVLEWLSWLLLGIVLALALVLNSVGLTAPAPYVAGFSLVVNVTTLVFSALLVVILAGLRSETVRAAMVRPGSDKSDAADGSDESDRSDQSDTSDPSDSIEIPPI